MVRSWRFKYALEWLMAFVLLLGTCPLLLVLGLAVKLTSRGRILHVSTRLGRNGRVFMLCKFRTMFVDSPPVLAADGKMVTLKEDPRVTGLGRFLRLGFDELPQLFNVIAGDMCLVGPRPDVPWELERYTSRQRERLKVLPGITGLAAVVGGRFMSNAENYELDLVYVHESSLLMDLKILLVTIPYSLGWERIGARAFRDIVDRIKDKRPALSHTNAP